MIENPYTDGFQKKDYSFSRTHPKQRKRPPIPLSCHFCGFTWDSKNRCFVCPKCHTTYNPQKNPAVGFGGEVKVARIREALSREELADKIGCSTSILAEIERGGRGGTTAKGKMIRERLRIWVESTKSPIERRKEIDGMFDTGKD